MDPFLWEKGRNINPFKCVMSLIFVTGRILRTNLVVLII